MSSLEDQAVAFVRECEEQGMAGFCLWVREDGSVRFATLELPAKAVTSMLRIAADDYEQRYPPERVN